MRKTLFLLLPFLLITCLFIGACKKEAGEATTTTNSTGTLKIAYVNGDTILHKYEEFRKLSEVMEAKQRKAEESLQGKLTALEKEFMTYQKNAQSGTMTPKEMEAREKYLGSRQESLMAERDKIARAIMDETEGINKRLKDVLHEKLDAIKARDGYDFILSYVEGGAILTADPRYNITDEVLRMLNEDGDVISPDTTAKK